MDLHPSQKVLLDFLKKNPAIDGFSLWGIARHTGLKNAQNISHHLRQLEKKGMLRRDSQLNKWVVLKQPVDDIAYVNVYGFAQCGLKSDAVSLGEPEDRIVISTRMFGIKDPHEVFAVRARGDSMEPYITNDDYVLFRRAQHAPPSGSIALVIDEDEPRIKKVTIQDDFMVLTSSNGKYQPKVVKDPDSVTICGHAVGVIKTGGL